MYLCSHDCQLPETQYYISCFPLPLQSPSTELFLSIVDFHSSPGSCAYFIMDRVDKLSQRIISDSSGQLHKEIDYGFVIGLMKQLILNAKLKFAQSGDSSGVELCDT